MENTKEYFKSQTLSANCSKEELELINEYYEEVTGTQEQMTFRKYLITLHNKATSMVRPNISKKEDLVKIEALDKELNDLKILHTNILNEKDAKIEELSHLIETQKGSILELTSNESDQLKEKDTKIQELSLEIESLNDSILQLSSKEPEKIEVQIPIKLTNTQYIINLTPLEKYFMDTVCQRESKRTGKPITSEIILKDIFNRYIVYGPCDYFPRPFSSSELKELHTKFNPKPV